jgi:hypothetical protein
MPRLADPVDRGDELRRSARKSWSAVASHLLSSSIGKRPALPCTLTIAPGRAPCTFSDAKSCCFGETRKIASHTAYALRTDTELVRRALAPHANLTRVRGLAILSNA